MDSLFLHVCIHIGWREILNYQLADFEVLSAMWECLAFFHFLSYDQSVLAKNSFAIANRRNFHASFKKCVYRLYEWRQFRLCVIPNQYHAPHQRTPTIWHCQIFLVVFSDWCDSHTRRIPPQSQAVAMYVSNIIQSISVCPTAVWFTSSLSNTNQQF
jgi:hypothetical protein